MRPNLSHYYTAHRWADLRSYCSSLSSSCGFHANLLLSHIVAALFALFMLLGARQIILMYSLARPRRLMASMPLYGIIVIHCGIMPTSLIAASCQLYCCISSSCDFHVVLYLYSGIRCHSHTPVELYCYVMQYKTIQGLSCGITADLDCGIIPTLLAALLLTRFVVSQDDLRHHCPLEGSFL
jgi:hypothetical protein